MSKIEMEREKLLEFRNAVSNYAQIKLDILELASKIIGEEELDEMDVTFRDKSWPGVLLSKIGLRLNGMYFNLDRKLDIPSADDGGKEEKKHPWPPINK